MQLQFMNQLLDYLMISRITDCYATKMDYYSAIKKNEIMPFATTWMDLKIIILSEISQTEKDNFHMWSIKYDTNKLTDKIKTDSQI